jgi:hypothetical protein
MDAADTPLFAAAPALIIAPTLAWAGARRADSAPSPMCPADQAGTFSSYPVLSIPVAMAAVAAGYRVITVGSLDATSLGLGAAVGASIAAEALAAIDAALRTGARRPGGAFRSLAPLHRCIGRRPDLVCAGKCRPRPASLACPTWMSAIPSSTMHPTTPGRSPIGPRGARRRSRRTQPAGAGGGPARDGVANGAIRAIVMTAGTLEVGALVVHA